MTQRLAREGYEARSDPMSVAQNRLRIQWLLKVEAEDLMLPDLLLAEDAELAGMPPRRVAIGDGDQTLWVAALPDLRALKRLRGSPQDLADLDALGGEEDA